MGIHGRTLRAAALKGLESEIAARSAALAGAEDNAISFSEHGKLWWDGAIVAKLVAGSSPLSPTVEMLADPHVKTDALQARLEAGSRRASQPGRSRCWRCATPPKPRPERQPRCPARRAASPISWPRISAHWIAPRSSCPAGKAGAADPRPAALRRLVRTAHRLSAQAAPARCGGAADPAVGRLDEKERSARSARAWPYLVRRSTRARIPPRSTPRAFASLPAAPSASTCWSGWRTNWNRRWPNGTDAETLLHQTGFAAGQRQGRSARRAGRAGLARGRSGGRQAGLAATPGKSRRRAAATGRKSPSGRPIPTRLLRALRLLRLR